MARILIVDDDPEVIDRLTQTLEDEHEILSTTDWAAVSRLFYRNPCDLVLMDVNLPGLSGDQLLTILKRLNVHLEGERPKLVYFTSEDEDRVITLTRETGADGYILKSARTGEIQRKVEAFLRAGTKR